MPTATFTADFTKWDAALKNAQGGLKPLEVSAKGVQQQLQRMVNAFSGTNIQKQAQSAVAAVNSIGGVTKLTDAEQKKLNATVTEAIAKYKALGQQAPADMVKIQKETKQTESALSGIGAKLSGLTGLFAGAFTVGAIANAAGEAIKFAGSLNDMAAKTGISVEALQEFKFAGSAVGVTLDDVTAAVLQMQKHLVGGDASVSSALKTIGVSFQQLKVLKPEDQFTLIATKLAAIEDPALRNKTAFDLMGKTAANVLPLIASGLDEARKHARDLGLVLDGDTVNSLDHLGDTWDALKVVGEAVIAKALVPFAPLLTDIAGAAIDLAGPLGKISKIHYEIADAVVTAQRQMVAFQISFYESINVSGKYDATLKKLYDDGGNLLIAQLKLERSIAGVATTTPRATTAIAHFGEGVKKAGDDSDKAREAFAAVVDDVLKVNDAIGKMFDKDAEEAAKREAEALKQFTDVINELSGQNGLEKALFDLDAFNAAMKQGGVTVEATRRVYAELEAAIEAVDSGGAKLSGTTEEQAATLAKMKAAASALGGDLSRLDGHLQNGIKRNVELAAMNPFGKMLSDTPKVVDETKQIEEELNGLSQALASMAQSSTSTFGTITKWLSVIVGAMNVAEKAGHGLASSFAAIKNAGLDEQGHRIARDWNDTASAILDAAANVAGFISAIDAATQSASKLQNALGGALAGATAGKAIAGWQGAAAGGVIGFFVGLFKHAGTEVNGVAYEFGANISKQVAQGLDDEAKKLFGNNRQAEKIFRMDVIFSEGGGLNISNITQGLDRLHDVYSLLQTGAFTAAQAQEVLDKNFQNFVDVLGGRVSPALKEIIRLNDEFGTKSKAIAQFVDAQANTALTSLAQVVAQRGSALDNVTSAQGNLSDLQKNHGSQKDIDAAQAAVAKAQAQLAALPLTKNSGAAFGGALFGIFERLQKDGVSAIDTLKQIDPVIESLDKQFAAAGISGGAAFDKIKSLAGIATDQIAGPSFEAIQNYGAALEGLNNAGILDQEQFTGLSDQITATYQGAVAALTAQGKDGSQALGLVAPQLQEIWELQQDFGYAVDDSTQKLLDQAVAAGDVGEKHRSVQEQTLDVMNHLATTLDAIGEKFGVTIPSDVEKTGKAFSDAKGHLDGLVSSIPGNIHIPVRFDYPDGLPPIPGSSEDPETHGGSSGDSGGHSRPMSIGGLVYASKGFYFKPRGTDTVPAMLTPGEFIVDRPTVRANGGPAGVRSALSGGGGTTVVMAPGAVVLNGVPSEAERVALAKVIMKLGPKVIADGESYGDWQRMVRHLARH